jgi:uncharacterized protein (DUF952 family)
MLYHLALDAQWQAGLAAGEYRTSTLGARLEDVGFLHAAFADQVQGVADRYYADVAEPVVLLVIDESRLAVPWRVDVAPDGHGYPHVYGPLRPEAVVRVVPVDRDAHGALAVRLPDDPHAT